MPTNDAQWAWFLFYTVGAALGWLFLVKSMLDFIKSLGPGD